MVVVLVFQLPMGILIASWCDNVEQTWQQTSLETLRYVQDNINDALRVVIFSARNTPVPAASPEAVLRFAVYTSFSDFT